MAMLVCERMVSYGRAAVGHLRSRAPGMALYRLCYRHNNQILVVIEPGDGLVTVKAGAQQVIGPIHIAACDAASGDYAFDDPEL